MKNFLYIVFLGANCYSPAASENNIKDFNYGDRGNVGEILLNKQFDNFDINFNNRRGIFEEHGYRFEFDQGNPDIHGQIERPCQAYDTFCIRKFFAEHSRCKISGRRLPDPIHRAQSTVTYPSANMSNINTNHLYLGLNHARVEEFYTDKITDNLVIAIYFEKVTHASNNTNLKYYLRGREPEVHQGTGTLIYEQVTITIIIPGLDDLRLDRAEIFSYVANPVLPFFVSPNLLVSSDPEVVAMATYFSTVNVETEHLEELSTEGIFFGTNYLQYNICDFGLKVL